MYNNILSVQFHSIVILCSFNICTSIGISCCTSYAPLLKITGQVTVIDCMQAYHVYALWFEVINKAMTFTKGIIKWFGTFS